MTYYRFIIIISAVDGDWEVGLSSIGVPAEVENVIAGRRFQHGHGLGSILSGFFRRLVLPFFKAHGKKILANAVKTSAEVADDVLEGKTVKESAKRRTPAGIKRTLLGLCPQSGSGVRRRKRRKIARDIFL